MTVFEFLLIASFEVVLIVDKLQFFIFCLGLQSLWFENSKQELLQTQIKIVLTEKLSLSFIIVNYFKTLKRYSGGAIHNVCIVRVISINI